MIKYKEIFLGNRCNNQCLYCPYRHGESLQPDLDTITTALERGAEDSVVFYGGEPTLRNDLPRIILAAQRNGYRRIKLVTNGRSFSDNQVLTQIVDAGCYLFEIKLWGSNPDLHDYLTQTPNSFLQTMQGLENLQGFSVDKFTCLRIPICKQNYTDMINTIIIGINFGVNRIVLSLQDYHLPLKDLLPHIKIALSISILNRVWILTEGLPFCVMQGLEHHVGEIYSGYDSAIYPRTHRHHKNCQHCTYQEICRGVETEYLNKFGHTEFPQIKGNKYFEDIRAFYS